MLASYKTQIETLPQDSRSALLVYYSIKDNGAPLFDLLTGRSQADLVLALLRLGFLSEAELLMGRQITYCPASLQAWPVHSTFDERVQWVLDLIGPEKPKDGRVILSIDMKPKGNSFSAERFALLSVGLAVNDFIARGGKRRDLRRWVRRGMITIGYGGDGGKPVCS